MGRCSVIISCVKAILENDFKRKLQRNPFFCVCEDYQTVNISFPHFHGVFQKNTKKNVKHSEALNKITLKLPIKPHKSKVVQITLIKVVFFHLIKTSQTTCFSGRSDCCVSNFLPLSVHFYSSVALCLSGTGFMYNYLPCYFTPSASVLKNSCTLVTFQPNPAADDPSPKNNRDALWKQFRHLLSTGATHWIALKLFRRTVWSPVCVKEMTKGIGKSLLERKTVNLCLDGE